MISIVGGTGIGAQFPFTLSPLAAHFFHSAGSARNRMNTPPTTGRAWKPTCVPLSVQYQSFIGTRVGVSSRYRKIGLTRASKSCFESVSVAVQVIQSSFV